MNREDIYNDIAHDIIPQLLNIVDFTNEEYYKNSNSVISDSARDDIVKSMVLLYGVIGIERSIDSFSEGSDTENVFRNESEKKLFEEVKTYNKTI
jgi:hypothetical protein